MKSLTEVVSVASSHCCKMNANYPNKEMLFFRQNVKSVIVLLFMCFFVLFVWGCKKHVSVVFCFQQKANSLAALPSLRLHDDRVWNIERRFSLRHDRQRDGWHKKTCGASGVQTKHQWLFNDPGEWPQTVVYYFMGHCKIGLGTYKLRCSANLA